MLKYCEPTVEKASALTYNDRFGFEGGKCWVFLFCLGRSPSKSEDPVFLLYLNKHVILGKKGSHMNF